MGLARGEDGLSPPVECFCWRCFFCGSFMLFLSCFSYAFVRVCLLMPCGHLCGKGWPLGSRLWCLIVKLSLSHWYPGSGVVFDCIECWYLPSFLFCCIPYVVFVQFWLNLHHTLTISQCMFGRKRGAEGSVLQDVCHFVAQTVWCMVSAIWLIVHTLWYQLLIESFVYPFKTLQLRYIVIEDVHVDV